MSLRLRSDSFRKIVVVCALLFCFTLQEGFAQSEGDVAFTGFNSDGPGDGFSVVLFTSYSEGAQVHFTSEEWDGKEFSGSGGAITWEAPTGGTSAGTVLVFSDVEDVPAVNIGTIADDTNMNLSGSGEVIYAFLGSDKDTPNSFLGAIATSSDQYNGTDGNLENTNLTQAGSETILLSENTDVAEFIGDRSGNTPEGYRSDLNDIANNWQEESGNEDQSALVLPFDDRPFNIVPPPTIAFTSSIAIGDEGDTVTLTVELVEADNVDVDVDVSFMEGSSSASGSDIDGFSSQTLSFTGASTGASQDVSITLTGSDGFEETEKAVFQLQNNTIGSVISPRELTLTITEAEAPDIVFNEINADPGDDSNGDGTVDSDTDEFIEWVNNSGQDIDISGWTYADGTSYTNDERFVFPEGTVIPSRNALVLFDNSGGIQPQGNFGGAYVFSDGEIGLNNGSETLSLFDENGNLVVSTTYPNEANDQSNVLDPEITGTSYIDHSNATGSSGNLSSPGTKVDGTAFGSKHAIAFRGNAGWRMISSPVQSATFRDFFDDFWMQGVTGSDDATGDGTLFSWIESGGGSFNAPSNMSNNFTPGKGYIVYVFEDDEFNTPGIQGGFPKVVNTNGTENTGTVNVDVSATDVDSDGITGDEGWNMLGNPFATDISVAAVLDALETVDASVNANIYVWDHEGDGGNGDWVTKSDGDRLAPFQAFFVKYTSPFNSTQASFDKSSLEINKGTDFYKNVAEDAFAFDLKLHGEQQYDGYTIEFSEKGAIELDRYDAFKLFSLNTNSINLFSTLNNNRLQKNVLPRELDSKIEIPFSFDANGRNNLTFRWNNLKDLPNDWEVMLIDKEKNREIDLRRTGEYKFTTVSSQNGQNKSTEQNDLLNTGKEDDKDPRFVLSVNPKITENETELPSSVKLNPNYPNPFNPQTTIPYELTQDSEVKLTVWNMIGQKVATLVDGTIEAGTHEKTWNASNMPSGIYIARFEVGNEVFTRKMTLIK